MKIKIDPFAVVIILFFLYLHYQCHVALNEAEKALDLAKKAIVMPH